MKRSLLYLFIVLSIPTYSQDYFSIIIPTTDNPLIKTLKKIENSYFIPTDFFSDEGVKGGLLIVNENGSLKRKKFENIDLGPFPFINYNDKIFLVGENPNTNGDSTVILARIDAQTYDLDWIKDYTFPVQTSVNTTIKRIEDDFYILNVNNAGTDFMYQRELVVQKVSAYGEELSKYYYNRDKRTTYGYSMFNSYDSNLILSNIFSKYNENSRAYSQIIKINPEGDIIWKYEGTELLEHGAVPTWSTELSDSTILQTYTIDRFQDLEYIINDWNPYPNKFIWLSKDGELIKEKTIISEDPDDIIYSGVKQGFGNYFFAYGELESLDPLPGLKKSCHLTKFSNSGDTIWTHNYQHPDFSENNNNSYINDIIEEENGDITVLATLRKPLSKSEVWLFKLNSDGCYINSECEDMTNLVSVTDTDIEEVTLYPNPVINEVTIKSSSIIKSIKIRNTVGGFIKELDVNNQTVTVEMKDFPKGLYNFQIFSVDGKMTSKQVVKW